MVNEVNVGGHVGLVVDRNLDMKTVNAYAEAHGQNIKGTKVDGQLVIYFSDKASGINPISSFMKQYRGKQAIRQIMEQSWGEKVASHLMDTMKDAFSSFGDYLTRNQTVAMQELAESQLPQAGPQPSLADLGAQADIPRDQMPPPAFSDHSFQRESPPRIVGSDADFGMELPALDDDDDDDDIYDGISALEDEAPATTGPEGELHADDAADDDDDVVDGSFTQAMQTTTSVDGETEGSRSTTGGDPNTIDPLQPPPVRPLDHTDLPDPPVGPVLRSVVAWSLEDLPEPPTHSINHVATKSEESLAARRARQQAGRPRSATTLSNNHVQGLLFAQRLTSNPAAFKELLKEAREGSGSDLLGDGGFRKTSGIDRFEAEAAIARYFARQTRPIAAMNGDERRALAIKAIQNFINLPDPSSKPVDN